MNIEELKKKLHEGPVKFSYKKKDGSIREALGTLKLDIIPEEHHPKNNDSAGYNVVMFTRYYDLNSAGWRSFRNDSLIDE